MKQLSALGARRHFFRNPRRMRALRAGMSPNDLDDGDMMAGPGFGYFSGNSSMANLISDRRIRGEKNSIIFTTYYNHEIPQLNKRLSKIEKKNLR